MHDPFRLRFRLHSMIIVFDIVFTVVTIPCSAIAINRVPYFLKVPIRDVIRPDFRSQGWRRDDGCIWKDQRRQRPVASTMEQFILSIFQEQLSKVS